ncbi:MAG TPA: TetR/AcrR family transcriptional regulator [Conexibacter sp.]|nr:TetR/AcrR family transcriptional regulator [Conexibacter sp.]
MSSRSATPAPSPTPRGGRRRLPGHERRVLIFDAALRTFAASGYDGAAMDEIAAAAGVSKAVVYDHVTSKRELYTHLLDMTRGELEQTVSEALRPPIAGGQERVHAAMTAVFQYVEEHPEASRLLLRELQAADASPIGHALEDRIAHGIASTLGSDPELLRSRPHRARQLEMLAELLKSAVLGLANWWYRNPKAPRGELVERSVAVVWPAIERARADILPGG